MLRELLINEFGNEETVDDILAKNVIDFIKTNWKKNT
jgi:hypothetical protein